MTTTNRQRRAALLSAAAAVAAASFLLPIVALVGRVESFVVVHHRWRTTRTWPVGTSTLRQRQQQPNDFMLAATAEARSRRQPEDFPAAAAIGGGSTTSMLGSSSPAKANNKAEMAIGMRRRIRDAFQFAYRKLAALLASARTGTVVAALGMALAVAGFSAAAAAPSSIHQHPACWDSSHRQPPVVVVAAAKRPAAAAAAAAARRYLGSPSGSTAAAPLGTGTGVLLSRGGGGGGGGVAAAAKKSAPASSGSGPSTAAAIAPRGSGVDPVLSRTGGAGGRNAAVREALLEHDLKQARKTQHELARVNRKAREVEVLHGRRASKRYVDEYQKQREARAREAARGLVELKRNLLRQGIDPAVDLEGQRQLIFYETGCDLADVAGTPYNWERQLQRLTYSQSTAHQKQHHRQVIAHVVDDLERRGIDPLVYLERTAPKRTSEIWNGYTREEAKELAETYASNLRRYGQIASAKISVVRAANQLASSLLSLAGLSSSPPKAPLPEPSFPASLLAPYRKALSQKLRQLTQPTTLPPAAEVSSSNLLMQKVADLPATVKVAAVAGASYLAFEGASTAVRAHQEKKREEMLMEELSRFLGVIRQNNDRLEKRLLDLQINPFASSGSSDGGHDTNEQSKALTTTPPSSLGDAVSSSTGISSSAIEDTGAQSSNHDSSYSFSLFGGAERPQQGNVEDHEERATAVATPSDDTHSSSWSLGGTAKEISEDAKKYEDESTPPASASPSPSSTWSFGGTANQDGEDRNGHEEAIATPPTGVSPSPPPSSTWSFGGVPDQSREDMNGFKEASSPSPSPSPFEASSFANRGTAIPLAQEPDGNPPPFTQEVYRPSGKGAGKTNEDNNGVPIQNDGQVGEAKKKSDFSFGFQEVKEADGNPPSFDVVTISTSDATIGDADGISSQSSQSDFERIRQTYSGGPF